MTNIQEFRRKYKAAMKRNLFLLSSDKYIYVNIYIYIYSEIVYSHCKNIFTSFSSSGS